MIRLSAGRALIVALTLLFAGCGDAFFHDPAPAGPARIAVRFSQGSGGAGAAFDKADNLGVTIADQETGEGLFAGSVPVSASGGPIEASVDVELPGGATPVRIEVTVRRGSDPLFTGATSVTLLPGESSEASISLSPVAFSLNLPTLPTFTTFGQTFALGGEVLFATGDVIPAATVQWQSLTPGVLAVEPTSGGGFRAVARADGMAALQAAFGTLTQTVAGQVNATVVSVEVLPPSATLTPGQTLALTAILRDGAGNPIPGRTPSWLSSNTDAATVGSTGIVTALAPGTTDVSATREGVTGKTVITVRFPGPTVTTLTPQAIQLDGATVRSLVDPRGASTLAWFQFASDPGFAQFSETPAVTIPGTSGPVQVFRTLTGLSENTTYYVRGVAENSGGRVFGSVASFTTLDAPNAPSALVGAYTGGVRLTWTDNSANESYFEIERELVPPNGVSGSSGPARVFSPIGTVSAGVTDFNDTSPPTGQLRYRVRACNADGCSPFTPALTWYFGLPPLVFTETVGALSWNQAIVRGRTNPLNAPTTVVFQVGRDAGFTTPPPVIYPTVPLQAGSGAVDVSLSTIATSLQSMTTYYVRIIATNPWGTSVGNIQVFTTLIGG